MIYFLLIISLTNLALAEENCSPEEQENIRALTSLSVPNCIEDSAISREANSSMISQSRREKNLQIPTLPHPICEDCRNEFRTKMPSSPSVVLERKQATFETSYNELEKSLTSIIVDVVGLRKTWSTQSTFQNASRACDTKKIQTQLESCNSEFKGSFRSKNLSDKLANEMASLLTSSRDGIGQILQRPDNLKSCPISDDQILNLKSKHFEEMISPEMVAKLADIQSATSSELQSKIRSSLGGEYTTFEQHPILRELMKNPSKFSATFRSLRNVSSASIKDQLRSKLYSKEMGDLIDSSNAAKCTETINSFVETLCSPKVKNGEIALGPFTNFDKFSNGAELDPARATTTNELAVKNTVMFEFCEEPINNNNNNNNNKFLLNSSLKRMNNWMLEADRSSSLSKFGIEKYQRDFGDIKEPLCNYLPAADCNSEDGEQCALYRLYRRSLNTSTPEGRLALTSDAGANNVLRAFLGESSSVTSSKAKQVLIAEGILPQSNGQFVERPQIPERQPEYLAGVANGTITPNVSGSSAVQSQASRSTNRNSQSQAQPQISQPIQGNSAVNANELAANDGEDAEALRTFENDLEERRRNLNSQQPAGTTRNAQTTRRQASRPDSSGRTTDRTQSAEFIPAQQIDASSQVAGSGSVAPTVLPEARLGQDPSRRGLSNTQRNAALEEMAKKNDPSVNPEAGHSPASEEATFRPEASLTMNIESGANLERVLTSNENLRALIQEQKPFRFKLNNNVFDVQFKDGNYTVSFRSGASNGSTLASTLQGIFNNSLRRSPSPERTVTLDDLRRKSSSN